MATDYIPQSYPNLGDWLANFKTEIAERGARLGLTPGELAQLTERLDRLAAPVAAWVKADRELGEAAGRIETALAAELPSIRREVRRVKTAPAYTEGDGEALGVIGDSERFDASSYRPTLVAEALPGRVRLKGRKGGVASMTIYTRLKGQATWRLLVARRSKFPFDDDAPLAVPGTPEVREYRALGVVADEEIGQPSDIVEVVFGG